MPVYGYKCNQCETEYEVFYKTFTAVDEEERTEACPKCDSKDKTRLINTKTSFQLKGRGWAKDRYGKGR